MPAAMLNAVPGVVATVIHSTQWLRGFISTSQIVEKFDVVVLQRNLNVKTAALGITLRAAGKTFILDLDDGYSFMDETNPAYKYWYEGQSEGKTFKPFYQQLQALCHIPSAITSPSRKILEDWSQYGARGVFVPNYIEVYKYTDALENKIGNKRLVLGWGGSTGHMKSWTESKIIDGLARVARTKIGQVIIMVCGAQKVYELLKTKLGARNLCYFPATDIETWYNTIASFDIGLAPLSGLQYDLRRSPLKGLEYLALGIPWVHSKAPFYSELDKISKLGFEARNTAAGWTEEIINVIDGYEPIKARFDPTVLGKYDASNPENQIALAEIYKNIKEA
jgi:hypothetical protein